MRKHEASEKCRARRDGTWKAVDRRHTRAMGEKRYWELATRLRGAAPKGLRKGRPKAPRDATRTPASLLRLPLS